MCSFVSLLIIWSHFSLFVTYHVRLLLSYVIPFFPDVSRSFSFGPVLSDFCVDVFFRFVPFHFVSSQSFSLSQVFSWFGSFFLVLSRPFSFVSFCLLLYGLSNYCLPFHYLSFCFILYHCVPFSLVLCRSVLFLLCFPFFIALHRSLLF